MTNYETSALTREVAGIIRGRMARFKVSQTDLAEAVPVSQSQLSKIVRGQRTLDIEVLDAICWALGTTIEEVLLEATTHLSNFDDYRPDVHAVFVEEETRLAEPYLWPSVQNVGGPPEDMSDEDLNARYGLAADHSEDNDDLDLRTP